MGTYNKDAIGPNLSEEELRTELPPVKGNDGGVVKISDKARDRIAKAIDLQPQTRLEETKKMTGEAFNGGSTYKTQ